jgi:hypothetical protein
MRQVGFELTISAGERAQNYALDRAVTGAGDIRNIKAKVECMCKNSVNEHLQVVLSMHV